MSGFGRTNSGGAMTKLPNGYKKTVAYYDPVSSDANVVPQEAQKNSMGLAAVSSSAPFTLSYNVSKQIQAKSLTELPYYSGRILDMDYDAETNRGVLFHQGADNYLSMSYFKFRTTDIQSSFFYDIQILDTIAILGDTPSSYLSWNCKMEKLDSNNYLVMHTSSNTIYFNKITIDPEVEALTCTRLVVGTTNGYYNFSTSRYYSGSAFYYEYNKELNKLVIFTNSLGFAYSYSGGSSNGTMYASFFDTDFENNQLSAPVHVAMYTNTYVGNSAMVKLSNTKFGVFGFKWGDGNSETKRFFDVTVDWQNNSIHVGSVKDVQIGTTSDAFSCLNGCTWYRDSKKAIFGMSLNYSMHMYMTLYEYNLETGALTALKDFSNPFTSTTSIVYYDDRKAELGLVEALVPTYSNGYVYRYSSRLLLSDYSVATERIVPTNQTYMYAQMIVHEDNPDFYIGITPDGSNSTPYLKMYRKGQIVKMCFPTTYASRATNDTPIVFLEDITKYKKGEIAVPEYITTV